MSEFSTCSIEILQSRIKDSKAGKIDLRDYWNIGDARVVPIPESMQRPFIRETEVEFRVLYISDAGEGQTATFDYSNPMSVSHYYSSEEVRAYTKQLIIYLAKSQFGREPTDLKLDVVDDIDFGSTYLDKPWPHRNWPDSKMAWTYDSLLKEIPPIAKDAFGAI